MRRKFKPIDINDLLDADELGLTTIKGEMRKLYPAIHEKLTQKGWTAQYMVDWLSERGIEMTVDLFRVYLRALDKENNYKRSEHKKKFAMQIQPLPETKENLPIKNTWEEIKNQTSNQESPKQKREKVADQYFPDRSVFDIDNNK